MAGRHIQSLMAQLQCAVCLETLTNPRDLPCPKGTHVLCTACLEGLVQGPSITCPICRTKHILPSTGVDGFPQNLALAGIIESLCMSCKKAFPETACSHCSKQICLSCQASHLFKELKHCRETLNHVIQESKRESKVRSSLQGHPIRKIVDEKLCKLIKQLEERRKTLNEDEDKLAESDAETIQMWKQELDDRIAQAEGYLAATDTQVGDEYNHHLTNKEMADLKALCESKIQELQTSIDEVPGWTELVLDCNTGAVASAIAAPGSVSAEATAGPKVKLTSKAVPGPATPRVVEAEVLDCDTGAVASAIAAPGSVFAEATAGPKVKLTSKAVPGSATPRVVGRDRRPLKYGEPRVIGIKRYKSGEFLNPNDVAVCPITGHVVVVNFGNYRVQVLDADLRHIIDIRAPRTGLWWPWGVAVDGDGHIIVSYQHSVHVYGPDGTYIHELPGLQGVARGLAVDQDQIYVCDARSHVIRVYSKAGELLMSFGGRGSGPGKFSSAPCHVTPYQDRVMVSDGEGQIHEFTKSGSFIRRLDRAIVRHATGLAVMGSQNLIIATGDGPITGMSGDLVIARVGETGRTACKLDRPGGVAVSKSGQIIVANCGHHNVLVYDPIE